MKQEKILNVRIENRLQSTIYNITLEGEDTFFANSILTHNTPPHMPPVDAIKDWSDKKLGPGKEWALAMHIKKHGTKSFPFLRPTLDEELIPILKANLKEVFK